MTDQPQLEQRQKEASAPAHQHATDGPDTAPDGRSSRVIGSRVGRTRMKKYVRASRKSCDTGVDAVHTTFGRTNGRHPLPQALKKQRIEAKNLERTSRRSCHHHNLNA